MFQKIFFILMIVTILVSCAKEKEEQLFDQELIDADMTIFPKQAHNFFLGDLSEQNKLEINAIHHAFNTLDKLLPITYKMVESSEAGMQKLKAQANQIAQSAGYRNLDSYSEKLNDITWAAATYKKMCKFEKTLPLGVNLPINRFSAENIRRRLEKLKLSTADLKLLQTNWKLFSENLEKMKELAESQLELEID